MSIYKLFEFTHFVNAFLVKLVLELIRQKNRFRIKTKAVHDIVGPVCLPTPGAG